jgi:hypothetical protein
VDFFQCSHERTHTISGTIKAIHISRTSLVGTGFSQESTTSFLDNLTISAFDTPVVSTDATLLSYLQTFVFSTTIYTKTFAITTFPYGAT